MFTESGAPRGLIDLDLSAHYRTGEADPARLFYEPCLSVAYRYLRAAGYFRSSVFSVVGLAMLKFARRGGSMRLVCSPSITEEDARALQAGYKARDAILDASVTQDLDLLFEQNVETAEVLAILIKAGSLDIRFAIPDAGQGIYHEKLGLFTDRNGSRVSFIGSANETWNAWHPSGNHEAVEVFRDWAEGSERERVSKHQEHLERLWQGQARGLNVLSFPEAQRLRLINFAGERDVHSQLAIEREQANGSNAEAATRPLLPHQRIAVESWEQAGRSGIFQHATGSGKTVTALEVIRRHVATGKSALVLVPSRLLLQQWQKEIARELPGAVVLLAGAGHARWKTAGRLRSHTGDLAQIPRVTIATMATAASEQFLSSISDGAHLLLVADEVHQIGSTWNSRAMQIRSGGTLGLSATPVRYGDPDGTGNLIRRFGPILEPVVTLLDAISAGRLVEYEYHPHPLYLSDTEAAEWKKQSERIRLEVARGPRDEAGQTRLTERAKMLLIQRSRIAKKAAAKPGLAAGIVSQSYRDGQKWLVYCEDADQLKTTLLRLREAGVEALEYHSQMTGDREAAMRWFAEFGGVLVSIKCLDEGVDIPDVTHAVILASSQNPRQFIQRRGRVLRRARGKNLAVIHDAIVVPLEGEEEEQTGLLRSELARALEFANSALNADSGAELREIALRAGMDLAGTSDSGIEDDPSNDDEG